MSIKASVYHLTHYRYDRPVVLGPQVIRLRPAPHSRTRVLAHSVKVTPSEHFVNHQQDPYGNWLSRFVFPEPVTELKIEVDLVADMTVYNPFDFFVEDAAEHWPFDYPEDIRDDHAIYMKPEPAGADLKAFLATVPRERTRTVDFVVGLNARLAGEIGYVIRMEPGVQTPEETLEFASGSCRDSAWLLVQILRNLGLAARFVSGYLIQLTPDVKSLDGPTGTDVDFTDLHAWCEVYVPGAGWIGLDATSGLLTGEGHIPLAATPNPTSAAPITGSHGRAEVQFEHHMAVTRVRETPRVTKPYSDEQWQAILDAGHAVDERLKSGDVRLSMGGEPTFVAADDMEGAEWNTAAVGPNKRRYADDLVRRLRDRFAKGGLLHYGQGKWYPGEQLPRWAFALYWRADGEALWEDQSLIARETTGRAPTPNDLQFFMRGLCTQLGLPTESGMAAYEDPIHFMAVEQKLPLNVTVEDNKLEDPAERQRIMRTFERGLGSPVGYVLPVQVWHTQDRGRRWVTERWALRRGKLFLVPGDSPIGFRLPLGSAPLLSPIDYPHVLPRDPFAPAPALPERRVLMQRRRTVALEPPQALPGLPDDVVGSVRTALAVEARDGRVCVFMPPLADAEDYAAMIAAIEETARATDLAIHIEGYEPPRDPRLNVIKVTPDPGVIEVNVQPAMSWDEAVNITTGLYEDAHFCRLSAEKFMLDGRHSGTGGGNHIVLGGKTCSGPGPVAGVTIRRARHDVFGALMRRRRGGGMLSKVRL